MLEIMYFGAYPVITDYSAFALDVTNQKTLGCVAAQDEISVSESLMNAMRNPDLSKLNSSCQKYDRTHFDYGYLADKLDRFIKSYY